MLVMSGCVANQLPFREQSCRMKIFRQSPRSGAVATVRTL